MEMDSDNEQKPDIKPKIASSSQKLTITITHDGRGTLSGLVLSSYAKGIYTLGVSSIYHCSMAYAVTYTHAL